VSEGEDFGVHDHVRGLVADRRGHTPARSRLSADASGTLGGALVISDNG
jgi:hypothetical protein